MRNRSITTIFIIAVLMLACNMPGASGPANPPATASGVAATSAPASAAAAASDTPAAAAGSSQSAAPAVTDTPSTASLTPVKDPVNCRFGPMTTYESVGAGLAVGNSAQITGKSADGAWWQIPSSDNKSKCWVAASVVRTSGHLTPITVVAPPAAFVTDLMLVVKPTSFSLGGGCSGPKPKVTFTGTIYVNGPTTVQWYFETEDGGKMSLHSSTFSSFGHLDVSSSYTHSAPKKGSYWVRLYITSPNMMMMEADYQIKCS